MMVLVVGDTVWFKDGDDEVRLKDLPSEDAADYWSEVGTTELVGKTIAAVVAGAVPGAYGDEPCTYLVFTDGTARGYVQPADIDD